MTAAYAPFILFIVLVLSPSAMAEEECNFKSYQGDEEFWKLLMKLPLIAEVGGGHYIKMPDGSNWLVGIGSTARRDPSASEVIRQTKVTRIKAQAAVVEYLNGSSVSAVCVAKESTELKTTNGQEMAFTTETLDEVIVTKAKGIVTSLSVIGSWTSRDGTVFFQAIGKKME